MGRRIAVYGATDEALQLLPLLTGRPDLEVAAVFDPQASVHRRRLALLEAPLAATLQRLLTDDPRALEEDLSLDAVVDAGIAPPFRVRFASLLERGVEVLTPREACNLVDAPPVAADPKREVLQALEEIAAAIDLAATPDALAARLLEAAIAATGAAGGSLLLREADDEALGVRAAVGLEPELWPKVRVRLGAGVAGRVWAEGRAIAIRGRANPELFELTRERFDIASALCIPLWHDGAVRGVLSLHHPTREDLFGEADRAFGEQLGALVARIAMRADQALALRRRALRAEIAAEVAGILGEAAPLALRLAAFCRHAAERAGRGVATLWWTEAAPTPGAAPSLRLAASSLAGGALGAAARLAPGEGVDGRVARDREAVLLRHGDRLDYAALPLLCGPDLLGVLAVQAGADTAQHGDEAQALRASVEAAAAWLGQELRAERAAARATRGEVLHEATLRMLAETDPTRIAESLGTSAALGVDAEHVFVRVLDEARRSFRLRWHSGATSSPLDDALAGLDRRVAREVLRRRAPIDIAGDDDDHAFFAVPLLHAGRALGTLAVYDKQGPGGPHFDALDRETLTRLAAVAARILATTLPGAVAGADPAVERFVPFPVFARRIDEELARAAATHFDTGPIALVTCRIENWDELPADLARRAARTTATALLAQLRSFDVATRTAPGAFCALLPLPGAAPSEHVARLARAVAEAVAKQDEDAGRVALGFGYALDEEGERSRADLLARASEPRIRML